MIIKSMARKAPTFAQLIAYIGQDAEPGGGALFARNLYHSGRDETVVAHQFQENWGHLPERANGNALYHEVIVLERQDGLDRARLNAALLDIAERYCRARADCQLAWGRIHHDTDHPHIHLMISANAVRSAKRARLDKASFARIQRDVERYASKAHPDLTVTPVYDRGTAKETPKVTRGEGERGRRTGATSRKEDVYSGLSPLFETAQTRAGLKTALIKAGFHLYQRGVTFGVEDQLNGRRYRLKTLGLLAAFERLAEREQTPVKAHETPAKTVGSPEGADRSAKAADTPASSPGKPSVPALSQEPVDPRAAGLLSVRKTMEREADDRLRGFTPDQSDEEFER